MRLSGLLVTLPLLALGAAQQQAAGAAAADQPAAAAQPAAADQPAAAANPAAAQPAAAQPAAAQPAAAQPAAAQPAAAQPAAADQPAAAAQPAGVPAGVGGAAQPAAAQPAAAVPAAGVPAPAAAAPAAQQSGGQPVGSTQGTYPAALVGTWSTKSNKTLTGPGFYNPLKDVLIEPTHTGISYSFTADGFFESAYFRAVANPQNPACPKGIMQWQHGSYQQLSNGSLVLTPISHDGRQLFSNPCNAKNAVYTYYNQTELFQRFNAYVDPYHGIPRLDLYKFDGSPMNPMFIAFKPPQMLPTTTLHPTATASASATSGSSRKRSVDMDTPVSWNVKLANTSPDDLVHHINADRLWWLGLAMTGVGGLLYLGPRRMGIPL